MGRDQYWMMESLHHCSISKYPRAYLCIYMQKHTQQLYENDTQYPFIHHIGKKTKQNKSIKARNKQTKQNIKESYFFLRGQILYKWVTTKNRMQEGARALSVLLCNTFL
mmetsp:Transcript_19597/g.33695  ORF Transcript_19597/g.33695 Transcript_19597/m.33695 type:complete len:109 (+) Transcript_19597:231-557(+)